LSTSPVIAVNDIGSAADFLAAIEGTIRNFNDGDLVEGTVVQGDREEVLLDIGYKTEGVIPSRELSIRHDADPNDIVKVGDKVEALVLQKEDKEGRLILSKKRAQYERAWGEIEGKKERDEVVIGTVIEVVKGGLIVDIGLRGFLPASLVEMRRVATLLLTSVSRLKPASSNLIRTATMLSSHVVRSLSRLNQSLVQHS
jgi:small subunit ribosomal protein S1